MKQKYSEVFIEQAVVKLLSRGKCTVREVALDLNVNYYTAKNRMKRGSPATAAVGSTKEKRPQDWSAQEQLLALQETHGLSGEALQVDITPAGERLVGQRSIVVQRPANSADAPGGVRALTEATDAAIEEIEQWLLQTPAR